MRCSDGSRTKPGRCARQMGYERMYLETHTNLAAAIHVYVRAGYQEIHRPVGSSTAP